MVWHVCGGAMRYARSRITDKGNVRKESKTHEDKEGEVKIRKARD